MIWHDGQGACLFTKRLERGRFLWPSPADGVVTTSSAQLGYLHGAFRWPPIADGIMRLTSAQLAALVDGMDWSRLHARDVTPPTATS